MNVATKNSEEDAARILIAEDSEDNRLLLRVYLKNAPYTLTFVEDGERALQMARSHSFDLILMDLQMPVMDGLTSTRLIREAEREEGRERVPVVALTANVSTKDVEASLAAGCNCHVSKPVSKSKLLRVIEDHTRHPEPSLLADRLW